MNNTFLCIVCNFVKYILIIFSSFAIFCNIANADIIATNNDYTLQLEDGAKDFLTSNLELEPDERANIDVIHLDPRKNIPICEGELEYSIASGKIRKNNTIKAQCHSETTPFSIYIVIKLIIEKPFVTVIEPVLKDTILSADNLTLDYMDKIMDRGVSFSDPSELEGIRTKRDLRPGQPIQKNQICVVCLGSTVTIEATNGLLSVKTTGEALQDGSFQDTIRVKNMKSGKTVRAKVVNSNLVVISID